MNLTRLTMARPVTVLMMALTLMVLGAVSLARLKVDFLPAVEFPFIGVLVPYPNAVPGEIEREIAKPVEEILATLGDVEEIFSQSNEQGAFIGVTFAFGREVNVLRLEVKEKLDQVRATLPPDVRELFLLTFDSNDIPIMEGRISARGRDLAGSYDLLERRIIRPLERIEGVGRVQVDGIAPQEIAIYLKMEALIAHNVDVGALFRMLDASNVNLSVGKVTTGGLRYALRTVGALRDVEEVRALQVSPGVRLSDVADVELDVPTQPYYRRLNGESAIAFIIQKASGANTVELSRAVKRELERINHDPMLAGVDVVLFFNQAESIEESLNGLLGSGLVGSLLAILILFFFLRHVRTTLVISISIPFSVIATCVFLYLTDRTLNLLTMMGLMLAVGMLVDNAIVVLEAIYQHQLRGESGRDAALKGANEVGMAVTASTLTSVIVFAPIVLGGGNEIIVWLREVGITITVTLLLSLLVSLTLVPMLCARLQPAKDGVQSKLVARWQTRYVHWLDWCTFKRPRLTAWVLIPAFTVVTILLAAATGTKPEADSERGQRMNRLRVTLDYSDNVNLHRSDELTKRVEDFLIAKQDSLEVANIYSFYRAGEGAVTMFFDRSVSEREMRRLRTWLRKELPEMAGVKYEMGEEEGANKGAQRVEVSLFGEDSDLLHELALEVKRRLALLPDLRDVRTDVESGQDEVQVVVQREAASRLGVRPGDVAAILNLTFRGMRVRDLQGAEREVPMTILLQADDRRELENLRALPVAGVEDRTITLDQVAGFEFAKAPQEIRRRDQRTAVAVSASYEGEKLGKMNEQVERTMNGMSLPQGYSWSFGRRFQQAQQEQNDMLINILLAMACVYFVMAALFESLLHPLVIMLCIPFSLLGVIWMLALTHTPLNIMAMIGLVILIGVIVNNGIVLIDHVNNLRRRGMARRDAVLQAGAERFRPILMTASTTVLGLLPLAMGDTALADAQYYPMARALIGGLLAGTILTLLVLPTFYVLAEDGVQVARRLWARSGARSPLPEQRPTR